MTIAILLLLFLLLMLLTLASYVERVFTHMGRFITRDFQDNIDAFEQQVEPRLGRVAARAEMSMSLLAQLSTAAIAMIEVYVVVADGHWTTGEILQAAVMTIIVISVFNQLLPFVLFTRTRGEWLVPFAPILQVLIYLLLPITLLLSFFVQIAALAQPREPVENEGNDAVDAFIEAGEDEGILEEGDRELIQSVVEFRDKTVREVMTPRPEIIAVPISTTIEEFTTLLSKKPYSRMPVYETNIDNIRGMVYAHDVLQIADTDAPHRTVGALLKPAHFVPESKHVEELLRELQREKMHMAIVIDEYGAVAGVVTIEDLVEEIVGEIRDEHEAQADIIKENDHSYVVPGSMDVDRLRELFGVRPFDEDIEATTVAGLVSELLGRIPKPGEVIEQEGLRYEILESTDRRVIRLRVSADRSTANDEEAAKLRA